MIIAKEERTTLILLGAILCIAAALRLWALSWGLPLKKAHIDEAVVLFYTMRFFSGDLNPRVFFDYPTLFLYLLAGVFLLYFLFGRIMGAFSSLDHFVGVYLNGDASTFYVLARLLSVAFAVGSVYLVYRLGREQFSKRTGLLAAAAMAVVPVHVLHSHYATVDVACVFFVLLAFLFLGRYFNDSRNTNALYLGAYLLGLASAVKYYPVVFLVPLIALVIYRQKSVFPKLLVPVLCLPLVGFVTGCPYALLDFPAFSSRFIDRFMLIVWSPSKTPFHFNLLGPLRGMISGITAPLAFVLAAGSALALAVHPGLRRKIVLWSVFPCAYLLFIVTWNVVSAHYLLPVIPFLILLGVYGIESLPALQNRKRLAPALVLLLCLIPAAQDIRADLMLSREDTRLEAYRWIKQNLPEGSRILRLPYTPEFRPGDRFFVQVDWEGKMIGAPAETVSRRFDYVIAGDGSALAWEEKLKERYEPLKEWNSLPSAGFHHPRVVLYKKR